MHTQHTGATRSEEQQRGEASDATSGSARNEAAAPALPEEALQGDDSVAGAEMIDDPVMQYLLVVHLFLPHGLDWFAVDVDALPEGGVALFQQQLVLPMEERAVYANQQRIDLLPPAEAAALVPGAHYSYFDALQSFHAVAELDGTLSPAMQHRFIPHATQAIRAVCVLEGDSAAAPLELMGPPDLAEVPQRLLIFIHLCFDQGIRQWIVVAADQLPEGGVPFLNHQLTLADPIEVQCYNEQGMRVDVAYNDEDEQGFAFTYFSLLASRYALHSQAPGVTHFTPSASERIVMTASVDMPAGSVNTTLGRRETSGLRSANMAPPVPDDDGVDVEEKSDESADEDDADSRVRHSC